MSETMQGFAVSAGGLAPAAGFALDPRFAGMPDVAGKADPGMAALPAPGTWLTPTAADGLPECAGHGGAGNAAFVSRPFGDGQAALPGTAILALLDAAAAEAGRAAAPRGIPAPDPIAAARAEAYAQGWADAQAAAAADAAEHAAALATFAFGFARLDAALSAQSAAWLADTVTALCEVTLAPLAFDAQGLAIRAARAVEILAAAEGALTIRLNPEDHAVVAPLLPADWAFRPDPALARGVLAVAGPEGGLVDDPADWPQAIRAAIAGVVPGATT